MFKIKIILLYTAVLLALICVNEVDAINNDYYLFNFTKMFSNGSVKAIERDDNAELVLSILPDAE
jgi:hypothetical protein